MPGYRQMEFRDYYQTLGVEKSATADEIKRAYRKLARKYHPDVSKEPDAELRMQEVNEANDVLSDLQKRAAYDQVGKQFKAGQTFHAPPNWDEGYEFSGKGFSNSEGFSDFFDELFKRAGREKRSDAENVHGEDRHARIVVDLADAYTGAVRPITLRFAQEDAQGKVTNQERTLNVQIPRGVRHGQHIRLAGKGYPGKGTGKLGDLYLEVSFKTESRYHVEGRDVFIPLPVAPWEAALGASVEATTPTGMVSVKVPADSSAGRKLRLKGRGIPGDPPGDIFLVLEVVLPPARTDKARQLYETMSRELTFNPRVEIGV